jgi:hypothetical protein
MIIAAALWAIDGLLSKGFYGCQAKIVGGGLHIQKMEYTFVSHSTYPISTNRQTYPISD